MFMLRVVAIAVVLVLLGLGGVAWMARSNDGPIGPFPGGPLESGVLVDRPVTDWSFADSIAEVELELLSPARSRRTWILVHDGRAYIPCALPNVRLWKQWPHQALGDGRAVVRIEKRRYPARIERIQDGELIDALHSIMHAKYDIDFPEEVWYFELASRPAD